MSDLHSKIDKNFKKKKNNFSFRKIDLRDADKFINKDYTKEKQKKFRNFKKWIELMDGEYIINNDNNDIIGRVFIDKNNKGINSLRVMDKYKGYGFGKILINDAIYNYHGEWLGVHIDNEVAIQLYKEVGFVEMKNSDPDAMYGEIMFMQLPKSILNKAKKNKVVVESVIKEKYLEGKLDDDKFNELMNYFKEG
jgi:GNAT superfamily N-acetyltransferase